MTNEECTNTTSELRHQTVVHSFHRRMCDRQFFDSTTKTLSVGCVIIPVGAFFVLSCMLKTKTLCEKGQEK